jgi:hypothetical protein
VSTNTEATLGAALYLDKKPIREQLADVARTSSNLDAKAKAGAFLAPSFWNHVGGEMELVALEKLNALSVAGVLAQGWASAQELREYADPTRHPAGERSVIPLGNKKTKHPYKLEVDLMAAGKKVATVELEITFEFAVQALQLGVVDGCIESIALGQLEVSATVECEGKQLKQLSLRKLDVPGKHHFDHPIPITGKDRRPADRGTA